MISWCQYPFANGAFALFFADQQTDLMEGVISDEGGLCSVFVRCDVLILRAFLWLVALTCVWTRSHVALLCVLPNFRMPFLSLPLFFSLSSAGSNDQLLFAGEHTTLKHAWIEGALQSGLTAAKKIVSKVALVGVAPFPFCPPSSFSSSLVAAHGGGSSRCSLLCFVLLDAVCGGMCRGERTNRLPALRSGYAFLSTCRSAQTSLLSSPS